DSAIPYIPENKPRYVMGVGSPEELIELISRGVDCFDSVYPTQNARHGAVFTKNGKFYLTKRFSEDFSSLENNCSCHTCKNYTKSYMFHLHSIDEPAFKRLMSIHNLYFISKLMEKCRKSIKENKFTEFKKDFLQSFKKKDVASI
ncbi:tRNA-guanine transglycosylase, partial [Candidatus Woesearchaeota archaeon]|nr:tRNA-guanine transglycosylase [Candidatus Woesearchaeota archaeon]